MRDKEKSKDCSTSAIHDPSKATDFERIWRPLVPQQNRSSYSFLFHSREAAQTFIQFTIANDSPCPENYNTLPLHPRSHKT